jgi:hypothetical protein
MDLLVVQMAELVLAFIAIGLLYFVLLYGVVRILALFDFMPREWFERSAEAGQIKSGFENPLVHVAKLNAAFTGFPDQLVVEMNYAGTGLTPRMHSTQSMTTQLVLPRGLRVKPEFRPLLRNSQTIKEGRESLKLADKTLSVILVSASAAGVRSGAGAVAWRS